MTDVAKKLWLDRLIEVAKEMSKRPHYLDKSDWFSVCESAWDLAHKKVKERDER